MEPKAERVQSQRLYWKVDPDATEEDLEALAIQIVEQLDAQARETGAHDDERTTPDD